MRPIRMKHFLLLVLLALSLPQTAWADNINESLYYTDIMGIIRQRKKYLKKCSYC